MEHLDRKRIAIITSYGLDKGGTEKFLQNVAVLLPKEKLSVTSQFSCISVIQFSPIKTQKKAAEAAI